MPFAQCRPFPHRSHLGAEDVYVDHSSRQLGGTVPSGHQGPFLVHCILPLTHLHALYHLDLYIRHFVGHWSVGKMSVLQEIQRRINQPSPP